jgi:hypothetical protein
VTLNNTKYVTRYCALFHRKKQAPEGLLYQVFIYLVTAGFFVQKRGWMTGQ